MCCLSLFAMFVFGAQISAQKVTAEEVIGKHLDSIGTSEMRSSLKNFVARGTISFTALRQAGSGGDGLVVFASEGEKSLVGMSFRIPNYPGETIVYDGKNLKVAYAVANTRSYFGDYLFRFSNIIKEGLLGGTLMRSWSLFDVRARRAKVRYDGKKKVSGRDTHVIEYMPQGGSDVKIKIFLAADNYEHVRTEYSASIPVQQGSVPGAPVIGGGGAAAERSSQQREVRQLLTEDFSNYNKVEGLNLPHMHKMYLRIEDANGVREYEFKAQFTEFFLNQQLDPDSFKTSD